MRKFDITTRRGRIWYWWYHHWLEVMAVLLLLAVIAGTVALFLPSSGT